MLPEFLLAQLSRTPSPCWSICNTQALFSRYFHLVWPDLGPLYNMEAKVPLVRTPFFPQNFNCFCFHSFHYLVRRHTHCINFLENIVTLAIVFLGTLLHQ